MTWIGEGGGEGLQGKLCPCLSNGGGVNFSIKFIFSKVLASV